jgi:hypothetical protein
LGPSRHPTRGFTAVVSVFRGTPPTKPSLFKNLVEPTGECVGRARRHRAGGGPWPALAQFTLALANILKMSGGSCSFVTRFRCRCCSRRHWPVVTNRRSQTTQTKNPATVREAGLKETRFLVSYLPASLSSRFPGEFRWDLGANPGREERRRNIWP